MKTITTIETTDEMVDASAAAVDNLDPKNQVRTAQIKAILQAAAPHLRAEMADELLDDAPGSPLTRGYQRLMDPKTGEHPVRTWEAAVRVMLDTLLEGGGEDK